MRKKCVPVEHSPVVGDDAFMQLALREAEAAFAEGEVPIGAIVVEGDKVIGRGHNSTITRRDPTAHAEMLAIKEAAECKGSYRMPEAALYVTAEPCLMCLGAALHARFKRIVYGTEEPKFGAVVSLVDFYQIKGLNHKPEIVSGVLAEDCALILKKFFQAKR